MEGNLLQNGNATDPLQYWTAIGANIFTIIGSIATALALIFIYWTLKEEIRQRKLSEKQILKPRITELIKLGFNIILTNLSYNLSYFKNRFFFRYWSFKQNGNRIEFHSGAHRITVNLKRFRNERKIELIIRQINEYNNELATFEEVLQRVVANILEKFNCTPDEIRSDKHVAKSQTLWKYFQLFLGTNVDVPENTLTELYRTWKVQDKSQLIKSRHFNNRITKIKDLERVELEVKHIIHKDANKLKNQSEELKIKTEELLELVESLIEEYKMEYSITQLDIDEYGSS